MVEVTGLEPAASWSQTKHSTKLSYTSEYYIVINIQTAIILQRNVRILSMFFGDYLFVCRPCLVQFGTSYFLESTAKCPRQTALLRGKIILKEQCLMTYIQSRIWSFSILIIKHTDLIINESKVKTKCRLTTKRNIRNFICRSSVA